MEEENPYLNVIFDYCFMSLRQQERYNGNKSFDINLDIKIPKDEYDNLRNKICKRLNKYYAYYNYNYKLCESGIRVEYKSKIKDEDDDDEIELEIYDQPNNLYIIRKYGFIIYYKDNEDAYIVGKLSDSIIIPLDDKDRNIAKQLGLQVMKGG